MEAPHLAGPLECTACAACVAVCGKGALRPEFADDGHSYIVFDASRCVQCHACEHVCPVVNARGIGSNDIPETQPLRGWSVQERYRQAGTSGGIFAALAHAFIEQGGMVVGASLQSNRCRHICIDKTDDIRLLQGSKYMYSSLEGIHGAMARALHAGRPVLFSGLPCQVAGVLSYFAGDKDREKLYTIDLVCGGMPSALLISQFLAQHPGEEILAFRSKEVYRLTCRRGDRTINHGKQNLVIGGLFSGLTFRPSCYNCPYARAHRASDITLGDYWQPDPSSSRGVSLLLVHNARGHRLLSQAPVHTESVAWRDFLPHNPKIAVGFTPWRGRWERTHMSAILHMRSGYWRNLIFASAYKRYDPLALAYIVYRHLRGRIEKTRRRNEVNKILMLNNL